MSRHDNLAFILSANVDSILDTLQDGIYITDRKGETLKVNSMYEKLSGLRGEDLIGRNVVDLQKEGVFSIVLNPEIVATGKSIMRVQTNMHNRRIVLTGYPIVDEKGDVILVVTYARDITVMSQLKDQIAEQRGLIEKYQRNFHQMSKSMSQQYPFVFVSDTMTSLMKQIERVSPTDATVLLLGETGVGKDVLAHKIHEDSSRHDRPFLKVDCASIPENLIESELFGYAPGAFSGASPKGKLGFFEMADKGTLFLDEIGELPLSMQSKLLRVLQDQEVVRVGSTLARKVDVRVISSTNRDLISEVKRGTFRSDLYYRLRVTVLDIPPLRERPDDILPLAHHFLEKYATRYRKSTVLSPLVEKAMCAYRWPGNVRELENTIQSLVIICERDMVELGDLPCAMVNEQKPLMLDASAGKPLKEIVAEIERGLIQEALRIHGSVSKVAELFGVNRATIFRKLQLKSPKDKDSFLTVV